MGLLFFIVIAIAIGISVGDAIVPFLLVGVVILILVCFIKIGEGMASDSQEKYGKPELSKPITTPVPAIQEQKRKEIIEPVKNDIDIIQDTIVSLRCLKQYGGELGENASITIEKIQHIENMDPGKASMVKRIDNLHRNYYPVLAHAINSFIKVGKSSKDYKSASKKLNESLKSFIDALDSIIEENAVGDIAEMSVDLNVLDSMLKKDGLKDQVKMKL